MPAAATRVLPPELRRLRERVIDSLMQGLADNGEDDDTDPDFDAGYTRDEVEDCTRIVDDLLDSLDAVNGRETDVLKVVRATVDRLNELNERCDCALIDAPQRDDLCDLINAAARRAGLSAPADDDITEAWREW